MLKKVTDECRSYNYFSNNASGYHHIVHNHGHGQFGFGDESTSHIENLWSVFKQKMKKIYNIRPSQNITLFIREIEFRLTISNLNDNSKIKELFSILSYIDNNTGFKLYPLDDFKIFE